MKQRLACFFIPLLTAIVLLYQVLSSLQIAVTHAAILSIICVTLAIAAAAGLIAALGPAVIRVGVLVVCALIFLDVTFRLSGVFQHLQPETRKRVKRDDQRIADIHQIKAALDEYVAKVGPLPTPEEYGEGTGPAGFWQNYWDFSSDDKNHDGKPFLDFLVDGGILPAVPVDPVNTSPGDDPRVGKQYVYFLVPSTYKYAGGVCDDAPDRWHYLVAISDLEDEASRPPVAAKGSGCDCFWRDEPNFFQKHFDYVLCGSFDATAASRSRAAAARAQGLPGTGTVKPTDEQQDRRRVADLLQIRQAFDKYLHDVGPLPAPSDYGEAEKTGNAGFWKGYWDVSSEDGNGDGRPFLDFLVDSGTMESVPVDPENRAGPEGDPRTGSQYVYYLVPPDEKYEGGSCATGGNQWVYLLGITDLHTQVNRSPVNITGSGCECLWRNKPNFFQEHFDYVACGTFEATPRSRARAAQLRAKFSAARLAREQTAAAQAYGVQDQRRVGDLLQIKKALQTYIAKIGPLPAPREYGEAETTSNAGFWQHYWDVSTQDGDGDGKPFLDFLVDSGTMASVPVDPDNVAAPDGGPKGGRQYVYFVAPPSEKFGGGTCGARKNQSVYLLGITDLRSELTRPPKTISGSGCECLWREQPNFFEKHFDYVTCGTFAADRKGIPSP